MLDIVNDIKFVPSLFSQEIATDTTTVGAIIDLMGYGDVAVYLEGVITDGTYTPVIHTGDNSALSDAALVADGAIKPFYNGTSYIETAQEAGAALATTQTSSVLGLKRDQLQRYLRISLTSASTSTGAVVSASVLREALTKSAQGFAVDTLA